MVADAEGDVPRPADCGFTLIELMVVVLIMGILMAVAIPTFLSTKTNAYDASAKSDATNAFTGEKATFSDNLAFVPVETAAAGAKFDASLPWGSGPGQLSATTYHDSGTAVSAPAGSSKANAVLIEASSISGRCFYIYDSEQSDPTSILGYAVTSGGCASPSNLAFPETVSAVQVANGGQSAGAHLTTAAAGVSASGWYPRW